VQRCGISSGESDLPMPGFFLAAICPAPARTPTRLSGFFRQATQQRADTPYSGLPIQKKQGTQQNPFHASDETR
jgi:hypothetical protein